MRNNSLLAGAIMARLLTRPTQPVDLTAALSRIADRRRAEADGKAKKKAARSELSARQARKARKAIAAQAAAKGA
ncbi:hypothetical protein HMPREF9702_03456 [Delftia acidovorans CCUG 15835]|nr:hypothetical protein HMPREF9702_03456 [Delftia acidovorans CCUG 15835]